MHNEDDYKIVLKLIESVGSKEECLRLGMLVKDDDQKLHISSVGFGYLLDVHGKGIHSLSEAYAAGFEQGKENT